MEALGWTSTARCVAFHDEGENAAACVHWFLFPSGKKWCWNVRNAASSFRRVLPKSIEDIWVIIPFQMWTPILWKRPPTWQIFHLPHRGDRGTCARNHSCSLTSIREFAEEVIKAFGTCQKILTEDLRMRLCHRILYPVSYRRFRRMMVPNLHWPPWSRPKRSQLQVVGNHWWGMLGLQYDPETK